MFSTFSQKNSTEIFANMLPICSIFFLNIVLNTKEQTGSKQSFHEMFSQENLFELLKKLPPLTICGWMYLAKLFSCFYVDVAFVSCVFQTWQTLLSVAFFSKMCFIILLNIIMTLIYKHVYFLSYTFTLNVLSHSKIQVEVYTYHPNNGKNDIEKEYRLQK